MTTKQQAGAVVDMVFAVAECIRVKGKVPSGHLYVNLMGTIDLPTYETILGVLIRAGLVKRSNSHLLTWIGPQIES